MIGTTPRGRALVENSRQIFLLRDEGKSYAEIAAQLGIQEVYARVLYRRGRLKIMAILNPPQQQPRTNGEKF